jgi:hypothetical protein
LALLRLMVGSWTGRSAGFAPLSPAAASTATCRRTRSAARSGSSSLRPSAQRIRWQHCGRLHSPSHSRPDGEP